MNTDSAFDKQKPAAQPLPIKQGASDYVFTNKKGVNHREAIRFGMIINDIHLYRKIAFFSLQRFQIQLIDISSRGACIVCEHKLNPHAEFILKVTFGDKTTFEIAGKIVRKDPKINDCYGFKFNAHNAELSRYLYKTHTEAVTI